MMSPDTVFSRAPDARPATSALAETTPRFRAMPRGTATLIGRIDTDWASMAAAGVLGALPIVIFAFAVQRHLVRGLTLGAIK